jgi:SPP1 family predicted phage head-tail adaptor
MKLGKFDQKIQFVRDGKVSDGAGGYIPGEILILETFAAIEQLAQSRQIEQVQLQLPSTWRVSIHARKDFTPEVGMRVKWSGEKYNIITSPFVEGVRYKKSQTFDICRS